MSGRWWDDVASVVEQACENSWRTDQEQRALLRVAQKVDRERSKDTTTNPDPTPAWLERHADQTRSVEPDQRRITPSYEKRGKR